MGNRAKYILIKVLCLAILTACDGEVKKRNDKVWKILDADFHGSDTILTDISYDNCFLSVYPDSTYTFFLNGFYAEGDLVDRHGEYRLMRQGRVGASFVFEEQSGDMATISFQFADTAGMKTRNSDEVAHSLELPAKLLFSGFRLDLQREKRAKIADPYTRDMNRWREKARHKESLTEIRERLKNHVAFMKVYFENAIEIGLGTVSEPNLASPFEVFTNGIRLRKFEEIKDWQDLFFDNEDAKNGYMMLDKAMETRFTLIKTENAFELNADIFGKLLKVID